MPSAAKKPSASATKSLMPMPLGATRTFLMLAPPCAGIVATIHDRATHERARVAAPQLRLMLATLMTDEALRKRMIGIWKKNLWQHAVDTVRRYQKRGKLRTDLKPEAMARAVISLNLGYIIARVLLAPDAPW